MKIKTVVAATCLGLVAGAVGAGLTLIGQRVTLSLRPVDMSYADLSAVLLAASALMMAIIGLFVAALAIWGITALRGVAKTAAKTHVGAELRQGSLRTHVEKVVTDFLDKELADGKMREYLEERLDAIIVTAPQARAAHAATTEDDVPMDDV